MKPENIGNNWNSKHNTIKTLSIKLVHWYIISYDSGFYIWMQKQRRGENLFSENLKRSKLVLACATLQFPMTFTLQMKLGAYILNNVLVNDDNIIFNYFQKCLKINNKKFIQLFISFYLIIFGLLHQSQKYIIFTL